MKILNILSLFFWVTAAHGASTLVNDFGYAVKGSYIVNNNVWNPLAGPQTVFVDDAPYFPNGNRSLWKVTSANHNLPTNGAPASYPNVQIGCHWGLCTPNNPLVSRKANSFVTLWADWSTTNSSASGVYNKSYDLWFNTTPTTSGQANAQELMIWYSRQGAIQPIGSLVATIAVGSRTMEIWRDGFTTTYMYKSGNPLSHAISLKYFVDDAIARGYINPNWYLITIQAGYEIWQGGAGLLTNTFDLSVQ